MTQYSTNSTNILKGKSVKSDQQRSKSSVVKNQILKAQNEARKIIEEAQLYAIEVREKAESDAEQELKNAFEKGKEDALLELETSLIEAKDIREKIIRETEKDILKLAVKLAEKIVGREIKEDKKTIVDIVTKALQNARQQERITIRVNPGDLQTVEEENESFKSFAKTKYVDFIADPRVDVGGCLIESEVGTVDARLETQFRILERAMLAQADGEFAKDKTENA